jgi:hypothetical protein
MKIVPGLSRVRASATWGGVTLLSMSKIGFVLVAVLSLSGCEGMWKDRCQGMGFTPGTSDFGGCMLTQQVLTQRALEQFSQEMSQLGRTSSSQRVDVYLHDD